jgi:hypothetical protein
MRSWCVRSEAEGSIDRVVIELDVTMQDMDSGRCSSSKSDVGEEPQSWREHGDDAPMEKRMRCQVQDDHQILPGTLPPLDRLREFYVFCLAL